MPSMNKTSGKRVSGSFEIARILRPIKSSGHMVLTSSSPSKIFCTEKSNQDLILTPKLGQKLGFVHREHKDQFLFSLRQHPIRIEQSLRLWCIRAMPCVSTWSGSPLRGSNQMPLQPRVFCEIWLNFPLLLIMYRCGVCFIHHASIKPHLCLDSR